MAVIQVHIPKTGGSALRFAIKPTGAFRWGHSSVLPIEVSASDRYVVTVRDPVARFLSAYAWSRPRLVHRGIESAEACAHALRDSFQHIRDLVVFRPQVEWVHSGARLHEEDILGVLRTETLDEDFAALCERAGWHDLWLPPRGHHRRNEQHYSHDLSPRARALVRERYADDVRLIEEVR